MLGCLQPDQTQHARPRPPRFLRTLTHIDDTAQLKWMRQIGVDETVYRDPDPNRCAPPLSPSEVPWRVAVCLRLSGFALQLPPWMPEVQQPLCLSDWLGALLPSQRPAGLLPPPSCCSGVNVAGTVSNTVEEFESEDKPRAMRGYGQVHGCSGRAAIQAGPAPSSPAATPLLAGLLARLLLASTSVVCIRSYPTCGTTAGCSPARRTPQTCVQRRSWRRGRDTSRPRWAGVALKACLLLRLHCSFKKLGC